jgi:hypothetical protein
MIATTKRSPFSADDRTFQVLGVCLNFLMARKNLLAISFPLFLCTNADADRLEDLSFLENGKY